MPLSIQSFYDDLVHHDWYYEYSDDGRVWRQGRADKERLEAEAKAGGVEYEALYQGFARHYFSYGNGPELPARPPVTLTMSEGA